QVVHARRTAGQGCLPNRPRMQRECRPDQRRVEERRSRRTGRLAPAIVHRGDAVTMRIARRGAHGGAAALALVAALAGSTTGAVPTAAPGPPVLSFLTQPGGSTTGGVPFSPQPIVLDVDAGSVPRVGDPVVLSIVPGTGTAEANLNCDQNPVLTDVTG